MGVWAAVETMTIWLEFRRRTSALRRAKGRRKGVDSLVETYARSNYGVEAQNPEGHREEARFILFVVNNDTVSEVSKRH